MTKEGTSIYTASKLKPKTILVVLAIEEKKPKLGEVRAHALQATFDFKIIFAETELPHESARTIVASGASLAHFLSAL